VKIQNEGEMAGIKWGVGILMDNGEWRMGKEE
jgi:hypothetical protein